MSVSELSTLFQALATASTALPFLTEDGRAEYGGGGYDYISAPGAIRTIKPALLEVGLLPTVTGCQIIEVAGKQVAQLNCRLVHLESGETLVDVFSLPMAPSRGRDDAKAAQAAITSGLGRWLRCLLMAVQAGEDEIDRTETSSARRVEPPAAPQEGGEDLIHTLASLMGVEADEAAMWATRVGEGKLEPLPAMVGTLEGALKEVSPQDIIKTLTEDLEKAKARGMTPKQFGDRFVRSWCASQIPF